MSKNTINKVCLLLGTICLFSLLCGCGKGEEIKFRDIAFGTKFKTAIPAMKEDLKGQGYYKEPEISELDHTNVIDVSFSDIKLYDYVDDVHIAMCFLKNDNQTQDDAELVLARYNIYLWKQSKEEVEKCYNYFYDKLTEIYGNQTKITEEVDGWKKGDTVCIISQTPPLVSIEYKYIDANERINNAIKEGVEKKFEEIENEKDNANKGL